MRYLVLTLLLYFIYLSSVTTNALQLGVFVCASLLIIAVRPAALAHPTTWFTPIFSLYALSFPVLATLGFYPYDQYVEQSVTIHLVALCAFYVGAFGHEIKCTSILTTQLKQPLFLHTLIAIMFAATVAYVLFILNAGFTSKQDIAAARSSAPILRLVVAYLPLTLFVMIYIVKRWSTQQTAQWMVLGMILWLLMSYLVSGERDLLFRFLLAYVIARYEIVGDLKATRLYVYAAAVIILLPITQAFKGFFLDGDPTIQFSLYKVFAGEFRTAGQALYNILKFSDDFYYGETLLWDLKRALRYSPNVLGTGAWYNTVFLENFGAGKGFSLVAELYMNFKIIGVAVGYFIFGLISYFIYSKRIKHIGYYAAYLMYISVFLYVQRADLGNWLSLSVKSIIIPLLFWLLVDNLQRRKTTAGTVTAPLPQS